MSGTDSSPAKRAGPHSVDDGALRGRLNGHRITAATSAPRERANAQQVLGYASVDAENLERLKPELRRQVDEITSECERRGLFLVDVVRERQAQRLRPLERPGLGYVLSRIAAGEASGLVVSELSRVSPSVPQLGPVLDWFAHQGARFVAAVPGIDTGEEAGRLAVQAIMEVSLWERERLVERTRNGMRAARRSGPASVADHPELRERIAQMRSRGMTLQAIADQLNAEEIPTVRGGEKWRPSSVQAAAGYRRPPVSQTFQRPFAATDSLTTYNEKL